MKGEKTMKDLVISNRSKIELGTILGNEYFAISMRWSRRKDYTESSYKCVTLFTSGPRLMVYETVEFGKLGKVITIRQGYSGSYDVSIENTVKHGEHVYKEHVYNGSFQTLREAVKAKFNHYKD
jgi:hypothetical protein